MTMPDESSPCPKGRVIFVDDEPNICAMMSLLLRPLYQIETFLDGKSALESIRGCLPDLIISDIRMPGLSGFDLLHSIRSDARTRFIPVILLSANQDEASRVQGFEMGAVDYLTKPFSSRELLTRIAAHINSAQEALQQAEHLVVERTAELLATNEQLRQEIATRKRLEREILKISERERCSMGQDLHDGICQNLSALRIKSMLLKKHLGKIAPPSKISELRKMIKLLDETLQETRRIARGCFPVQIESLGLAGALRELSSHTEKHFLVKCVCRIQDPPPEVTPCAAHQIYRIAQEAISNAIKHAAAKRIWIDFGSLGGQITLTIRNDGRPFPENPQSCSGMGLRILQSRADLLNASLSVKSVQNRHTVVTCSFAETPPKTPRSYEKRPQNQPGPAKAA